MAVLASSRRLPLEQRSAFIEILEPIFDDIAKAPPRGAVGHVFNWQADSRLVSAVADALRSTETKKGAASARLADVLMGKTAWVAARWFELLTPPDQARLAAAMFEEQAYESRATTFGGWGDLDWQLPLLDVARIDRLAEWATRLESDHDRAEALVHLLPTYAAVHGPQGALSLREKVPRSEFRALSWAAIFGCLTGREREHAFKEIFPDKFYESDRGALAVGKIATLLDENEFVRATRWIVSHHGGEHACHPFASRRGGKGSRPQAGIYRVGDGDDGGGRTQRGRRRRLPVRRDPAGRASRRRAGAPEPRSGTRARIGTMAMIRRVLEGRLRGDSLS